MNSLTFCCQASLKEFDNNTNFCSCCGKKTNRTYNLFKIRILAIFLVLGPIMFSFIELKSKGNFNIISLEKQKDFNTFDKFLTKLALKESGNSYNPIPENKSYYGKYQIGEVALKEIGLKVDKDLFIKYPEIQEIAIRELLKSNSEYLKKEIQTFEGKKIKGIIITKSGLLAGAHLGGVSSVKKFLYSNGELDFEDGNKTKISKYINQFQNFQICLK